MRQSTIHLLAGWGFVLAGHALDNGTTLVVCGLVNFVFCVVAWFAELARDVAEQGRRVDALLKESKR